MDVFLDKKTSIFLIKSMKTPRKEIARAVKYMQDYKSQKEVMNMEYKKFNNQYVIRIDKGEEICAKLKEVAQKENIKLAYLTGIGAAGKVTAGVFDTKEKVFKGHTWEGDLEIVSIGGNINTMNGKTYTHFHISVADEAGNVYGGHLTEAVISGTGELVLTEIEGTVDRKFDEEIGLNLFKF